jgi:hypothetical protein
VVRERNEKMKNKTLNYYLGASAHTQVCVERKKEKWKQH